MNPTPEQLQTLRKQHNLSVKEFTALLNGNVSITTVQSWLYGQRQCPGTTFRLLNLLLEDRK